MAPIMYGNVSNHSIDGLTGAAYYTGTMYYCGTDYTNAANYHTGTDAIATWTGGTNGTWDTSTANNWAISGTAFTWVNQEVGAIFDNTGANHAITINGTAIAHALTVSGTGYSFSGGSLTVTAGGITANNSFTINAPGHRGGPANLDHRRRPDPDHQRQCPHDHQHPDRRRRRQYLHQRRDRRRRGR